MSEKITVIMGRIPVDRGQMVLVLVQHFVSQGTNPMSRSSTSNKNVSAYTFRALRGGIATRRVLRGPGLERFP